MQNINASGIHVEVWDRRFFLQMNSFAYGAAYRPAKRPAISIVMALSKPFLVTLNPSSGLSSCRSMLVGPEVLREGFFAEGSNLWVFDVAAGTPEFRDLCSTIGVGEVRLLNEAQHEAVTGLCLAHDLQKNARSLLQSVVYSLCEPGKGMAIDPRVEQVLAIIDRMPVDEVSVKQLAMDVDLSESRLRALFVTQIHCNLSRYIRFAGFWKALLFIIDGKSFTEAAQQAGFFDQAHFNRAVAEFSGFSPSQGVALFGTLALQRQRRLSSS